MKKFAVTDDKLLEKGCQHGEEDSKNKSFYKKSTSPVKKSR